MNKQKTSLRLIACLMGMALIFSVGAHLTNAYAVKELKTTSTLDKQALNEKTKQDEKRTSQVKDTKTYSVKDIPSANKGKKTGMKHQTPRKERLAAMAKGKP